VKPLGIALSDPAQQSAKQPRHPLTAKINRHPSRKMLQARRDESQKQFVLQRNDGFRGARIALARATAEQLTVDAPGFMKFGEDDVEAAGLDHLRIELDVGATPRHVGGYRDTAGLAGRRDDVGLLLVLPGVEHLVG